MRALRRVVANPVTWLVVALLGLVAAVVAVVFAPAGLARFVTDCAVSDCVQGTDVLRGDVVAFVAGAGVCAAGLVGYVVARRAIAARAGRPAD